MQLFTAGLTTTDDETVLDDIEVYGVDTDESIPGTGEEEDTSVVEVPATNLPLSETSLDILSTTIDQRDTVPIKEEIHIHKQLPYFTLNAE